MNMCFAHGSNMKKSVFRKRFGLWKDAKRATLEGYRVKLSRNTNTMVKSPGSRVYGVAYWIGEDQLKKIETIEKHGPKWKRIRVKLSIEGNEVDGVTHVLVKQSPSNPPSSEHLNLLLEGLKDHGWGGEALNSWRESAKSSPS